MRNSTSLIATPNKPTTSFSFFFLTRVSKASYCWRNKVVLQMLRDAIAPQLSSSMPDKHENAEATLSTVPYCHCLNGLHPSQVTASMNTGTANNVPANISLQGGTYTSQQNTSSLHFYREWKQKRLNPLTICNQAISTRHQEHLFHWTPIFCWGNEETCIPALSGLILSANVINNISYSYATTLIREWGSKLLQCPSYKQSVLAHQK